MKPWIYFVLFFGIIGCTFSQEEPSRKKPKEHKKIKIVAKTKSKLKSATFSMY